MYKLNIKSNFSFSNLLKKLPKIIKETKEDLGGETISSMKKTIENKGFGQYNKLTKIRIRNRQSGVYFPDKVRGNKYKTTDVTPLKQTGALLKSMKYTGKGIHMNHYGITHNDGLNDDFYPKYKMPKREFIDIGIDKTEIKEIEKRFNRRIENNFKK